jgi:hypothetical protein
MAYELEVFREVGSKAKLIGRFDFEVPPRAGEFMVLPTGKRVGVEATRHVAGKAGAGQPIPMHYQVLVDDD